MLESSWTPKICRILSAVFEDHVKGININDLGACEKDEHEHFRGVRQFDHYGLFGNRAI